MMQVKSKIGKKKKWEELRHPLDEAARAPPPFELAMFGH